MSGCWPLAFTRFLARFDEHVPLPERRRLAMALGFGAAAVGTLIALDVAGALGTSVSIGGPLAGRRLSRTGPVQPHASTVNALRARDGLDSVVDQSARTVRLKAVAGATCGRQTTRLAVLGWEDRAPSRI